MIKAWTKINTEQVRMLGVRQGSSYTPPSATDGVTQSSVASDLVALWRKNEGLEDDCTFAKHFPDYETARSKAPTPVAAAWAIAH